ncbi:MAG: hypothetical protein VX938_07935, partial [Myxococcota bacterium]|nr:hypothetical protein [Myxococcota bacterium]
VLAQLAERYALSRAAPCFRSGWHDSSGAAGSGVRSWVVNYPHIQRRCDDADSWIDQALAAGRLMAICGEKGQSKPQVVVDLGSGDVYHSGSLLGSVWNRYQRGEGIRAIAWWLETQWRDRSTV